MLSTQTAKAADEISLQVQTMRNATASAIDSIGNITLVIGQIIYNASNVGTAVKEQNVSTQEIARTEQHAAEGT